MPAVFAKKKIALTFAALCQKDKVNKDDSVAQLVEHIPFKDGVLGPNPNWVTIRKNKILVISRLQGFLNYF